MSGNVTRSEVQIDTGAGPLEGFLALPAGGQSLVLFAHGSGSSRFDPELQIVAGATHLFDEPGTLEAVVALAIDWFQQTLRDD